MAGMALRRGRRRGTGTPGPRALVLAVVGATVLVPALAGCSGDEPADPSPSAAPVALQVKTVHDAGALDEETRTDLETEVGDVLSHYVVGAFLGEFPRQNFVGSFDSFTVGAARAAAGDLDLLTASRFQDATAVRATRLDARLSFLVEGKDVVGASAGVRFDFEASRDDGATIPFTLRGRFMMVEEDGVWSVFGYDVARDDGDTIETEVSP